MDDMNSRFVDIKWVATYLGVSSRTIRRWLREGRFLAPVRVGRGLRWRLSDLERYISERFGG